MLYSGFVAMQVSLLAGVICFVDEPFKITTKRSNDQVEVHIKDDKGVFVIRSPFGISKAIVERSGERWPEKVLIQLKLKGLENFKLSTDKLKLEASISSHDGSVRLWKAGEEDTLLDSKSPYWMEIKALDKHGQPTKVIPLKDGCFEMQLPRKLVEENPKSFIVEWIDFYRN